MSCINILPWRYLACACVRENDPAGQYITCEIRLSLQVVRIKTEKSAALFQNRSRRFAIPIN